jgi:hypothetical protein
MTVLLVSAAATPVVAEAAVKSKAKAEVRLTLDGRRLTVRIYDDPYYRGRPSVGRQVFGKRIRAACGRSFRPGPKDVVMSTRRWPRGVASLSFDFDRDISRSARWCLIESAGRDGGRDIAGVSFLKGERVRLLDKGRSPSGHWWRLSGRRNARLEPCTTLRTSKGSFSQCFGDDAEREAELAVVTWLPHCPGDTFVFGATARSAARVSLTLRDGTTVDAGLYRRPRGSRVRAQYYLAVLPGVAYVRSVEARRADGSLIARERRRLPPAHPGDPACDLAIPD